MEISGIDSSSVSLDAQTGAIQERLALMAAHKVMKIEKEMGQQLVALLDPNMGSRFDKRA